MNKFLSASPIDFFFFNLKLGLGTDYTRYFEYPRVLQLLQIPTQTDISLLDVGSGRRGQFPLFLASQFSKIRIFSTDPRDDFLEQRKYVQKLGLDKPLAEKRLVLRPMDILNPEMENESLDRISCISTIEHILGNGDTVAVKNMAALLKRGGKLVISIPFNPLKCADLYRYSPAYHIQAGLNPCQERYFFERIYDAKSLHERLIKPSGLHLDRLLYFGEPGFSMGRFIHAGNSGKSFIAKILFRSYTIHMAMPILSPLFFKEIRQDQFDAEDWSGVGAMFSLVKD